MKPTTKNTNPDPRTVPDAPAPRKRFQIEKLEERVAPKKGGKGTHNCGGGGSIGTANCSTSIF